MRRVTTVNEHRGRVVDPTATRTWATQLLS
jgi:hypothetical protein